MIKFVRWGAIVGVAALLQGCPPPYIARLYNKTGTDISVYLARGVWIWQDGAEIRMENSKVTLGNEGTVTDTATLYWREPNRPLLQIGYRNQIFTYHFSRGTRTGTDVLPESYDVSPIIGPQYNFQLHSDGLIYAIKRENGFPAEKPEFQPPGYPISPISSEPM